MGYSKISCFFLALSILAGVPGPGFADESEAKSKSSSSQGIKRGYLDVDFGQMHYRTAGSGTKKILLIHQIPSSSAMFEPVMGRLANQGFHVLAIDLAGYGASDKPTGEPSIEQYANHMNAVLDHFGWDTAAVFGQHTGGSVAGQFAVSYSDRVSALILGAPMVLTAQQLSERSARFKEPLKLPELRKDGGHILEMWQRRVSYPMPSFDLEAVNEAFTSSMGYWNNLFDGTNAAIKHDLAALLPSIKVPTLIVTGSEDQQKAFNPTILRLRPDFSYALVESASSYIHSEKPDEWVDIVSRFVERARER